MKKNILKKVHIILAALLIVGCNTFSGKRTEYWHQRVSLFDELEVSPTDIVFFGNSITDGGEFQELTGLPNIKNRGISGDNVSGLLERVGQITKGHPKKIFILIGINDIAQGHSVKEIIREYRELISRIKEESPESSLYVQSVMPINNDFNRYKFLIGKENLIPELNKELKMLAEDNSCVYIDIFPELADPDTGKLKESFTPDGLHLSGPAYRVWSDILLPYLTD